MNPYTILAVVLVAAGLLAGGDHFGHQRGINEQKVADQALFDKLGTEITAQKAEAAEKYRQLQDKNLKQAEAFDQLKTELEKKREENRKITNDLRDQYAGHGLRFQSVQVAGDRLDRPAACSAPAAAPGPDAAPVVQLPDPIARDLRSLTYDADTLADDYRKCYEFATTGQIGPK